MALGAKQAIADDPGYRESAERSAIPILGVDGLPRGGKRKVDEGVLAVTVVCPLNAGRAIELVNTALRIGQRPPAEVVLRPSPYPEMAKLRR